MSSGSVRKADSVKSIDTDIVDQAGIYLVEHNVETEGGDVDERALLKKIDWHVVPLAFACYCLTFLDKVNTNYAAVMGLKTDLHLVGNQFANTASALFIAFMIAEIPNAYIIQKIPAGRWLGYNIIAWGAVTACTAAVKNYHGLLACRILLGVFEAAVAPCLMLITSVWYTRAESVPRLGFWYCGLGTGQMIGGILSFAFQHVKTTSIAGWRIMFVVLGVVTIGFGIATALWLPSTPMSASWLTEAEKRAAIKRIEANRTRIENKKVKPSQLIELITDPAVLMLATMTILVACSGAFVTTFSATIINSFGYTPKQSALLNIPSGAVGILTMLISSYFAGKWGMRWLWICIISSLGVIGASLMAFLPKTAKGGLLFGVYLVNGVTPVQCLIFAWVVANVSGQTKRITTMALISVCFSAGNTIGPQTFQAKDAPDYIPAKITVLATQSAAIMLACILRLVYQWRNYRKSKGTVAQEDTNKDENAWIDMTDKEDPLFRYTY